MVMCGKCHQPHDSVAQVRDCYGVSQSNGSTMTLVGKPVTDKQDDYIRSLITKMGSSVEAAGYDRSVMTRAQASTLIDALAAKVAEMPKVTHQPEAGGKEVKPGTYTLVKPDGSYRTLQFAHAKWADGKMVASYLSGPDNEVAYTGFAFINGGKPAVWKKFKADSQLVADLNTFLTLDEGGVGGAHDQFLDLAEAYAMESGNCMRCGHKLTVPASLHRGLGPVCAGIEGV